ncbi:MULTISPECIES: HEAT repeat domain-containing protein [Actinosynnema]|uniref:HEAT repeat domain-containing protein n=1 Tax=Actinosynnema TaxID=40566 RepID=UPI0020A2D72D|nr:HEAT repeat domain-containing protein [Actinosynnema pretiosum]MCP2094848.1 HEAT repeat [Actinosynnema pretiosum]
MRKIDWASLEGGYGPAGTVPDLLEECAREDPLHAFGAIVDLGDLLRPSRGRILSAAPVALPFLVDLAEGGAAHAREQVVRLIRQIAERGQPDAAWSAAVDGVRPRLLALLADPDPLVRRQTGRLASCLGRPEAVAALRERWDVETDRRVRCDLVRALGRADREFDLTGLLADDDPQVVLAAAHALAATDPAAPLAHADADALAGAVTSVDSALWVDSAWAEDARRLGDDLTELVISTGDLLADDPDAMTAYVTRVARDGIPARRAAVLGVALRLLYAWRDVDLVPLLGELLHDAHPAVRYRAAAVLACLGAAGRPHADRLVELLPDAHEERGESTAHTTGDMALWALAAQHDPRCAPALAALLEGDRTPFDLNTHRPTGSSPVTACGPWLREPTAEEVLTPLRAHADVLVGPIAARLARPGQHRLLVAALCRVLAAWGPLSRAARPVLETLVGHRYYGKYATAALKSADGYGEADVPALAGEARRSGVTIGVLGALGPVAAGAEETLRRLATPDETGWRRVEAAYALWRITGESAEVVPLLVEAATPLATGDYTRPRGAALHHLAEIGVRTEEVLVVARAVAGSRRRVADVGERERIAEDEALRASAAQVLR